MTKKIILLLIMLQSTYIFSQNLQTKLQSILEQNQLMGLTVHTIYGKKETTYNLGLRNEAKKLPVTDDTKFRIASISKSFAALGLMKLYDKKLFKLDDDISTYLGYKIYNPNFPDDKITFRMLLSHTSTLNDGEGYDAFLGATYKETPIPNINSVFLFHKQFGLSFRSLTGTSGLESENPEMAAHLSSRAPPEIKVRGGFFVTYAHTLIHFVSTYMHEAMVRDTYTLPYFYLFMMDIPYFSR